MVLIDSSHFINNKIDIIVFIYQLSPLQLESTDKISKDIFTCRDKQDKKIIHKNVLIFNKVISNII